VLKLHLKPSLFRAFATHTEVSASGRRSLSGLSPLSTQSKRSAHVGAHTLHKALI
jgi:hypothetical protein